MPAHLGIWDFIKDINSNATNSQQTAVHSFIFYNPSSEQWKVLYFSAYNREEVETGVFKVTSRIWDPNSKSGEPAIQIIPEWPGEDPDAPYLFCSGHSFLPDGNLLVAGGHREPENGKFRGLSYSYIFNTSNEAWAVAGSTQIPFAMNDGRWYPTLTTLGVIGDGKVIAMSGLRSELVNGESVVNDDPEIFNRLTGWSFMDDITLAKQPFENLYPGAHVIPYGNDAGKIFYSMPMLQAWKFNPLADGTTGKPYWETVGDARTIYRGGGCSVLLPLKPFENNDAKVLIIGGEEGTNVHNSADIINFNVQDPQWQSAPSVLFKRSHANATILADGRVILIGGSEIHFNEGGVTYAEVFDPEANSGVGSWTRLPAMTSLRMYHSSAVLMPDATVLVGGGDVPFGLPSSNTFQIYNPGYLFEGDRPEITSISATEIEYNSEFDITPDIPIETAILIRFGAPTHAFDQDQRAIFLEAKAAGPSNGQIPYKISTPNNANIAPKGYYMLFVLRPKSASSSGQLRIPSDAKFVHIS